MYIEGFEMEVSPFRAVMLGVGVDCRRRYLKSSLVNGDCTAILYLCILLPLVAYQLIRFEMVRDKFIH